jgi:hypothetical protein
MASLWELPERSTDDNRMILASTDQTPTSMSHRFIDIVNLIAPC